MCKARFLVLKWEIVQIVYKKNENMANWQAPLHRCPGLQSLLKIFGQLTYGKKKRIEVY